MLQSLCFIGCKETSRGEQSMLSSKEIEAQLKLIPLHYVHYNYSPVEYGKGVSIGISAYPYLRERQPHLIPTEKDFCNAFIAKTINLFPVERLMTDYEKYRLGLECRAKRAYRSLVREEHCITRMREIMELYGFNILYDNEDDWRKGIDVTIIDRRLEREHYVHLFVDSPSSRKHRKNKAFRGQGRDFTNHVDFPFVKTEGKKVGDFYLYSDEQIYKFMRKLRTDFKNMGISLEDKAQPV
jgi:hypothetical protein